MSLINVKQCDGAGWYVGECPAFESPLEPGVYLIPRNAVQQELPAEPWPAGTWPRWIAGSWVLQAPQQGGV